MVNYLASGQQQGEGGGGKKRKQVAREHKTSQESQYGPSPCLYNSVFNSQDITQPLLPFAKQLR